MSIKIVIHRVTDTTTAAQKNKPQELKLYVEATLAHEDYNRIVTKPSVADHRQNTRKVNGTPNPTYNETLEWVLNPERVEEDKSWEKEWKVKFHVYHDVRTDTYFQTDEIPFKETQRNITKQSNSDTNHEQYPNGKKGSISFDLIVDWGTSKAPASGGSAMGMSMSMPSQQQQQQKTGPRKSNDDGEEAKRRAEAEEQKKKFDALPPEEQEKKKAEYQKIMSGGFGGLLGMGGASATAAAPAGAAGGKGMPMGMGMPMGAVGMGGFGMGMAPPAGFGAPPAAGMPAMPTMNMPPMGMGLPNMGFKK